MERLFLDWQRPGLEMTVDYLVGRFRDGKRLALNDAIVAVPGGRVGRRLLELLLERAESEGLDMDPPQIVTVGRLPELLYTAKRPFADSFIQRLAWIDAIRSLSEESLAHVLPNVPDEEDLGAWLALGELLGRLHRELASDSLDFQAVVDCGSRLDGFYEAPRWRSLLAIQQAYLEKLDSLGLWDLQTARIFAIRHGECLTDRHVVLVGTVDLNGAQRKILDQIADRVTALVFAPESLADWFDEHGCLISSNWIKATIPLDDEQIEVVDSPTDQAAAAVQAIQALDGRYAAEEITIGVPDTRLVPYLKQQLEQAGVAARYGVGRTISQSEPYRVLLAVADYLEGRRFSAFASLVRRPSIDRMLLEEELTIGDDPTREVKSLDWLSEIDHYQNEHLLFSLREGLPGDAETYPAFRAVLAAVERRLARFADGDPTRPIAEWGNEFVRFLAELFGAKVLDISVPEEQVIVTASEQIARAIADFEAVPEQLMPSVQASEAIRLILAQVATDPLIATPEADVVEMLGWLELPLDDAPALIVTGMNEGLVPGSLTADLFLPNRLRQALGIEDNDRRYARDLYALSVLAGSRADLKLIAGRRSPEGGPLIPSRLLMALEGPGLAERVIRFFGDEPRSAVDATSPLPGQLQPGREVSDFSVPPPKSLIEPVRSMRVTEFRDYLACPYRYYLRHRLNLEPLRDDRVELDGAAFGSLAHEILDHFGKSETAHTNDAEAIQKFLDNQLDQLVREMAGNNPPAVLMIQQEQLRRRLHRFAEWQANRFSEGWRIEHVEIGVTHEEASLMVDGESMFLRGRIDRIDLNERTGQRMILDYKTSDTARSPEQTHRKQGEWVDLQLPLYRHLLSGMDLDGTEANQDVLLGYIVLPKDITKIGLRLAEWDESDLRSADVAAEQVVRGVRAERFWPPSEKPPAFSEAFSAICMDEGCR
ncbi:MAG: PD-(D/E)XK nuclease family protein [Planctomycetia bacterium]|jgi:RecB family exonuclease